MLTYPISIREPLIKAIENLGQEKWFKKPKDIPDSEMFQLFCDIAFHASFLTEEHRRPGFRVIYCNAEDLKLSQQVISGHFRIIRLHIPRPFTISELNRIAPAADLTRFLICVYPQVNESKILHIWGLLDTGERWWMFLHHDNSSGMPPPNFLTITSTAPGELSFSLLGTILLTLKNGALSYPSDMPVRYGPISDFLDESRQLLYKTIDELKIKRIYFVGHENDPEIDTHYSLFLESLLYNIRKLGHGGTVIVVPQEISFDDSRLTDRIALKYTTDFDCVWDGLVQSLVTQRRCWVVKFAEPHKDNVKLTLMELQEFHRLEEEYKQIDEELRDVAKSIASLTAIDGAIVITTQFKVLGFGGEIIATSPTLTSVTNTSNGQVIPLDSFGTRHRSAFRFCSSFEDSVAFIVSSDGGVKAVKRQGSKLLFWPDINEGLFGL